jgi:hypothetical protein
MVLHYIIYAKFLSAEPVITIGYDNLLTNMVPFKLSLTINNCLHLIQNISKPERAVSQKKRREDSGFGRARGECKE